jgi:hypothetical protein
VKLDDPELLALRLLHQGMIPEDQPTHVTGAYMKGFDSVRLVATIGWVEPKPAYRLVIEVNRIKERMGAVGVLVLTKAMIRSCRRDKVTVQAVVAPDNESLRRAFRLEGCEVVAIWGVGKEASGGSP